MISKFSDDFELVWFMFFKRIVFENTKKTIFKENLVFYLFSVFHRTKN